MARDTLGRSDESKCPWRKSINPSFRGFEQLLGSPLFVAARERDQCISFTSIHEGKSYAVAGALGAASPSR